MMSRPPAEQYTNLTISTLSIENGKMEIDDLEVSGPGSQAVDVLRLLLQLRNPSGEPHQWNPGGPPR